MKIATKILILTSMTSLASCKGCKKKEDAELCPSTTEAIPERLSATTPGYLKFTLGSVNYSYSGSGFWFSGAASLASQPIAPNYYSTSNTFNTNTKTNIFLLTKKDSTSQTAKPISAISFRNFIKTRNYSFSSALATPIINTKGFYIRVQDNSSTFWYSVNPVTSRAYQSSSNFNIVETFEFVEVAPSTTIKFKATFNCKLYNAAGDSTTLTNGETITSYSNI